MSDDNQKETLEKKIELITSPITQSLDIQFQIKEPNISISKFEGNILGIPETRNTRRFITKKNSMRLRRKSIKYSTKIRSNKAVPRINFLELKQKVEDINIQIKKENKLCLNELSRCNKKISEQKKEIIELKKQNLELFNELKEIKNEVDSKLKLVKIFNVKPNKIEKKQKKLKILINSKEEEIKIEKKKIKREMKQKEKYKQLYDINDINREKILKDKYKSLQSEILVLENDIKKLKVLTHEHQNCQKYISILLNKKNVLDNEYEFERKKTNMIEMESNINNNNNNQKDNKNGNIINQKFFIRNKSQIEMCKMSKNYINKQFELAHKKYERTSSDLLKKINESRLFNKPKNLFLDEEKLVLEKIIPGQYLSIISERYNKIENEKRMIKEKLNTNNIIKSKIRNQKNIIDFSNIKRKEQTKKNTNLKYSLKNCKKNIEKLNEKIKEMNEKIKAESDVLNYKNKENSKYKKHLSEIQKKIDNGKLKLISDNKNDSENVSDENESDENERNENSSNQVEKSEEYINNQDN